jgi:hypothetical protein
MLRVQRHITIPLALNASGFGRDVEIADVVNGTNIRFAHLQDLGDARAGKGAEPGSPALRCGHVLRLPLCGIVTLGRLVSQTPLEDCNGLGVRKAFLA